MLYAPYYFKAIPDKKHMCAFSCMRYTHVDRQNHDSTTDGYIPVGKWVPKKRSRIMQHGFSRLMTWLYRPSVFLKPSSNIVSGECRVAVKDEMWVHIQ